MLTLTILLVSFLGLAILFIGGVGTLSLILPEEKKEKAFPLTIPLGLALLVFFCNAGLYVGLGVKYSIVFYFLYSVFMIFWCHSKSKLIAVFQWDNLIPTIMFFVTLSVCVAPLYRLGLSFPTSANIDSVFYCEITRYIWDGGLRAPWAELYSPSSVLVNSINYGYWTGFNYLHAFISGFFGLEAYESFSISLAFITALIHFPLYYFIKEYFKVKTFIVVLALLGLGINASYIWIAYDSFAAQVMGIFFLVSSCLGMFIFYDNRNWKTAVIASVFLAGLFTSYPLILPHFFAILALYQFVMLVKKKIGFMELLKCNSIYFLLFVVFCGPRILDQVGNIIGMSLVAKTKLDGNVLEFIPLSEIFGWTHHRAFTQEQFFGPIHWGYSFAAGLLLFWGVWSSFDTVNDDKNKIISMVFPLLAITIITKVYLAYPYGYYKNISCVLPFVYILYAVLFNFYFVHLNKLFWKILVVSFIVLGSGLSLWYSGITTYNLSRKVYSTTMDLKPIIKTCDEMKEKIDTEKPIYLCDKHITQLWFSYFLKSYPAFFKNTTTKQFLFDTADIYRQYPGEHITITSKNNDDWIWSKETILENDYYSVKKCNEGLKAHIPIKEPIVLSHKSEMQLDCDDELIRLAYGVKQRNGYENNIIKHFQQPAKAFASSTITITNARKVLDNIFDDRTFVPQSSPKGKFNIDYNNTDILITLFCPSGLNYTINSKIYDSADTVAFLPIAYGKHTSIRILNNSYDPLFIAPWISLVSKDSYGVKSLRELNFKPIIPGSNVKLLRGWNSLESSPDGKNWRWSKQQAWLVVDRQPEQELVLTLEGDFPKDNVNRHFFDLSLDGMEIDPQYRWTVYGNSSFSTNILLPEACENQKFSIIKIDVPHLLKKYNGQLTLGARFTNIESANPMHIYGVENSVIDLGNPKARVNLVEGWSVDEVWDEDTFVWGTGKRSKIRFIMNHLEDMKLVIKARGLDFPEISKQVVNVYCNGKYVDKFTPDPKQWNEFELNLPRTHLKTSTNTLSLVYSDFVIPSKLNPNTPDDRELALPVDYIKFIAISNK